MRSIPTYNIIVSFDQSVFTDLRKTTPESMEAFLRSRSDSVLFTNIADNFIRLAHTYSFQEKSGKETDNFSITLELLDPGKIFEQQYFVNSLKQLMNGKSAILTGDTTETEQQAKKLNEKILAASREGDSLDFVDDLSVYEDNTGSVEKDLYDIGQELKNLKNEKPTRGYSTGRNIYTGDAYIVGEDEKQYNDRKSKYEQKVQAAQDEFERKRKSYIDSLKLQLQKLERPTVPTNMYIAYGCGSNIENWAGPFVCFMTGAKFGFSAETGFRTITLVFTVNGQFPGLTPLDYNRLSLTNDVQIYAQKPLIEIVKESESTLEDIQPLSAEEYRMKQNTSTMSPEEALKRRVALRERFELTTQAQRDAKLGKVMQGGRVYSRSNQAEYKKEEYFIDLHYAISECIKDYILKSTNYKANVIVFFPDLNELLLPLKESLEKSYQFQQPEKEIDYFIANVGGKQIKIPKKELFLVSEILKQCGFDVTEQKTEGNKIISLTTDELVSNNGTQAGVEKFVESVSDYMKVGKNLYISLIKKPGQSFLDPLNVVKSKLPMSTKIVQPQMFVENNIDFIKDFAEFCKLHKSDELARRASIDPARIEAGFDSSRLEEIIDIDESKPLLIYGDRTVLDRFFYGKIRLEKIGLFKFGFGPDSSITDIQNSKIDSDQTKIEFFDYNKLVAKRDFKYITEAYQSIAEKHFQLAKEDNCFNSYTVPTSQFAFTQEDANKIELSKVPVFKFGVQDSNVLDLDMDIDHFYFNILNSVFYQTASLYKSSKGTVSLLADKFNALLEVNDNAKEIVQQYFSFKNNGVNITDAGRDFIKDIPGMDKLKPEELASVFAMLVSMAGEKTLVKNLEWWKSENPIVHFYSMLSMMSKNAYRGTIRTLPFFHLSTSVGSLNPALLFVKETSILGVNKTNSISDALNGLWVIFGYEHTIGKGEAYSSFHITKDPRISLPNALTPEYEDSVPTMEVKNPEDR